MRHLPLSFDIVWQRKNIGLSDRLTIYKVISSWHFGNRCRLTSYVYLFLILYGLTWNFWVNKGYLSSLYLLVNHSIAWIYFCRSGGTVNSTLPFTANVTISISTSPIFRSWVAILSGFHRTFATDLACRQGTLTPPDTWSRPHGTCISILQMYLLRPILFPNLSLFSGLCSSNIPRYFLDFALCIPSSICYFSCNRSWRRSCEYGLQILPCYRLLRTKYTKLRPEGGRV